MTRSANLAASPNRVRRNAMVSSYLGTVVEMYDFLLYGTAASLVFPILFFNDLDPVAASIASFATLAAGYVARPLGGILFGHFGDRMGRKKMLVITLTMMGVISFLIGLVPTHAQIGVAAPIILVSLRVIQGIAVGGEWAGAALMSMEHAKPQGRGLAASMVASGGPGGAVLATLVLTAFSVLPEDQFLAWGWRVPFLLSAVLVVIAMVMRMKVTESPEFEAAQEAAREAPAAHQGVPLVTILTRYPKQLLSAISGGLAPLFLQSLLATFALNYAVTVGHDRTTALLLVTIANFVHMFTIPVFALLSDRFGRKPVMLTGVVLGIVLIWPFFELITDGSWWALLLAFMIGNPLVQGLMYGPLAAWISEKFGTEARYTGVSLSYQISSTLGAGLAPLIAAALLAVAGGGTNTWLIALFFTGLSVITGIAVLTSRETGKAPLIGTTPVRPGVSAPVAELVR
ncbi:MULTISPECIES: MFS transporter [unclassified Diaminobutyricimonas]|uniref:MFS transporter n=1 Tax=unclassified Diaminobutyricimonas TaxID=2643261 RepID=UPI0012F4C29E|nr:MULTISPECIES: MFS transporter [unclassified Diaminobutyricimonas]